jgi:two-component system chemotaxis response regulator CheB
MNKKVRVLIVDDSAVVRQTLTSVLESDPDIEVIGTASDPFVAVQRIQVEVPDVITLDVEMPRMDGITFLRKLMAQRPIPVVMCSSLTEQGSETLMQALEAGAVDVILKPRVDTAQFLEESRLRICEAVKAAAQARLQRLPAGRRLAPQQKLSADVMLPPPSANRAMARTSETVVCIGASTGGTESLREVLQALPADSPGIVIVQHMP